MNYPSLVQQQLLLLLLLLTTSFIEQFCRKSTHVLREYHTHYYSKVTFSSRPTCGSTETVDILECLGRLIVPASIVC